MTSNEKKNVEAICTFFSISADEFDSRKGSEIKQLKPILYTRLGSPFNNKKSWSLEYYKKYTKSKEDFINNIIKHIKYIEIKKPKSEFRTRNDYENLFGIERGGSRKIHHFSKKMKGKTRIKINKGNRRYSRKIRTIRKTRTIKKIRK